MQLPSLPASVVDGAREVSAAELAADVAQVAAGLSERAVRAGDRVVVSLPNRYEFVVIQLALDALGGVTVNLPTAFRREVGQVVRMTDARLCAIQTIDDAHLYGNIGRAVALDDGLGPLGADPSGLALGPFAPDAQIWLAFTSGSTGTPRAAVHTRRTLDATADAMIARYELGASDTILVAAPVGHAIGFCYGVRLACRAGARMVLQDVWDPEQALALIEAEACTFAAIPTPFLADLLDAGTKPRAGKLRHLLVGGAPVPRDQLVEAESLFGPGVASGYYGASECGAVLTCPPGAPDEQRLATDGVPMPGLEIRVVDEHGADVEPGSDGELLVRGPQVALGYWANNDSDEQFGAGGWFATRDRVRVDESGYATVTGRMKDVIFRGAVNVVPLEVEEAVASHPDVGRVVVFGRADRRLGEHIVAAFTATGEPPSLDDIRAWLASSGVARSKWPDQTIVVAEFPRTPSGKIDRARILEELGGRAPAS